MLMMHIWIFFNGTRGAYINDETMVLCQDLEQIKMGDFSY